MTRSRRWLFITGVTSGVLALLFGAALYTLQSGWFQQKLRQQVISRLERSTGARVEVGFFNFDWRTRTVDLKSLIFHGSEPPQASPLFQATRVRVGFKIASLLNRNLDFESVQIQQPEIHLIVRPDGSTNLPARPDQDGSSAIQNLIALHVHRFDVEEGGLQINLRRMPLRLHGQDMTVQCRYDSQHPAYEVHLASKKASLLRINSAPLLASIDLQARIERNLMLVRALHIASGNSNLDGSGTVPNFANLSADFRVSTKLDAADAAAFLHSVQWPAGEVTAGGTGHYDPSSGINFRGNIAGHKLSYKSGYVLFSNVDLNSDLTASDDHIELSHFVLTALGAKLAGRAELAHFRDLQVNAEIKRLDFRRAASVLFDRSIPWTAIAGGQIYFSGDLARRFPDGLLKAKLNLTPTSAGTPVSGNIDFGYQIPVRTFDFNRSRLDFPHTHLSFSGSPNAVMNVALDSTDLNELSPAIFFFRPSGIPTLPVIESNGSAHFDGTVTALMAEPQIAGNVAFSNFEFRGKPWDQFRSFAKLSPSAADFTALTITSGSLHAAGNAHLELANWTPENTSRVRLNGHFQGVDLAHWAPQIPAAGLSPVAGIASGSVDLSGPISNPVGKAQLRIEGVDSNGLRLNQMQVEAALGPNQVRLTQGRLEAGAATASFSGTYTHDPGSWRDGRVAIKIDSNGFPLASIPEWRQREPGVDANAEIHAQGTLRIASGHIEPATAGGILNLRNIALNNMPFGALRINAVTTNDVLKANLAGDIGGRPVTGAARVQIAPGSPMNGELHFDRVDVSVLRRILYPGQNTAWPFQGTMAGGLRIEGPLLQPRRWRSTLEANQVELRSKLPESGHQSEATGLVLHNSGPVIVDAAEGKATVRPFQLSGKDTALNVAGSLGYQSNRALDLHLNGSINLQILQIVDPSLQSSGHAALRADLAGTLTKPAITGALDIERGSFFAANLPNGLSDVNGRIAFNRDRATIQNLTARTGGGELTFGGFVSFGEAGPLVYHVQANADNVRLRYAGGISLTANADLRLTGSSQSSILSGTATVSRVVFNPNTDVGNLLAAFEATAAAPVNTNDFVNGLHLDVSIQSAPNLQLSTELSRDVEAEIEIRLRGTPDHPLLLGSISANQGDIKVFGTRYSINRGEVNFRNSVRIEPVLDLDLQTRTRGITVNITISGTMDRLNVAYRSDPPLQPRDIIALLTVGRAPETSSNVRSVQTSSDVTALRSNPSTVLGQAISPSPGRLSKLFGITNVKIDPMVQGIITNTPQARLTLEQQISRDLTVTYVTNLSQTAEQIFRVEWALNRQYSLVAVRDENGEFGIDIQYKKRFR
ncbi:MAG TPA: translocation/assembly module TamB domain-containing protein [Bryobacteraceae bacterium]|nr:translocation/assembly module TamB domain-containing protein [Bryobacteraceae bacterium]